jgi:hypothetical protein
MIMFQLFFVLIIVHDKIIALICHTRFWKANRMRTMYVPGSETHVHNDYIIGHHHTMLEINSRKGILLHQDVQDIHRVYYITIVQHNYQSTEIRNVDAKPIQAALGVCH